MGEGPGQGLLSVGRRGVAALCPLCLSLYLDLQHQAGGQSSPVEELLSPKGSQGAHVEQFLPPGRVGCLTATQPTLQAPSDQGGKGSDHSHPTSFIQGTVISRGPTGEEGTGQAGSWGGDKP